VDISGGAILLVVALGLVASSVFFGLSFSFSSNASSGTSATNTQTTQYQTSTSASSTQASSATSDMPTYVADYRNPQVALQLTAMGLTQKYVSGTGHKIYTYFFVNPAQTSPIPMSGVTKQVSFNVNKVTNNIYWFVDSAKGAVYGTIGADILMSPTDGSPTLNQYVNVNSRATGLPTNSPLAGCKPAANGIPPSINSGGEERSGIYLVLADKSENIAYVVKGGILLYHSSGEVDIVFLIDSIDTTHFSSTAACSVPTVTFSSPEIDWAVRAPPASNTIPGNYKLYPTIGGSLGQSSGTNALCLYQEITPS